MFRSRIWASFSSKEAVRDRKPNRLYSFEHLEAKISPHGKVQLPAQRGKPQVAHIGLRHPGRLTDSQLFPQTVQLPVETDPGEYRGHGYAPLDGGRGLVRVGGNLLHREGDQTGSGLHQLEGHLFHPAQGDMDIRRAAVVLIPGPRLEFAVAALGRGGSLGGQAVQHLPPQGVQRGQGHRQPVLNQRAHFGDPVRGAACFGQLFLHLLPGDGPAAGGLRNAPGGGGHPALPVLHSHLDGFTRADHGVKFHGNAGALPLVIGRLGLGEQLPGVFRLPFCSMK